MALHRGAIVMYVTNNGAVPAVTSAHYSTGTATAADVTAANADTVDLMVLGYDGTKFTGVVKSGTSGTLANIAAHTAGKYYFPS